MDVTGVKGPHNPTDIVAWARGQLEVALSIVDNPGGGLLFATQAIGQVKAALQEHGDQSYGEVVEILDRAEDRALRREFETARKLIAEAVSRLS